MQTNELDNSSIFKYNSFVSFERLLLCVLPLALIFLILTTVFTFLVDRTSEYLPAIFLGLAQFIMYSIPVLFGQFMFYAVNYNKMFIKSATKKNTDSTIELVAKIFNKRRKEMRERGAEERAMEKQDYDELMI